MGRSRQRAGRRSRRHRAREVVTRNAETTRPHWSRGTRRSERTRTCGCFSADSGSSVASGDTMVRIRSARARWSPRSGARSRSSFGFSACAFRGATQEEKESRNGTPLTQKAGETRRFLSDRRDRVVPGRAVSPVRLLFSSPAFSSAASSHRRVASRRAVSLRRTRRTRRLASRTTATTLATRPSVRNVRSRIRPPQPRPLALRRHIPRAF